jgi:hypothetical protein
MDRLLGLGCRMGSTDPVCHCLLLFHPPLAAAPRVVVRVPISSIKFDMKKRMRSYDIYIRTLCENARRSRLGCTWLLRVPGVCSSFSFHSKTSCVPYLPAAQTTISRTGSIQFMSHISGDASAILPNMRRTCMCVYDALLRPLFRGS